jgi:Tol biopolymer transport system component
MQVFGRRGWRSGSTLGRVRVGFAALACVLLIAALLPSRGLATFPGRDGLIAFSQGDLLPGGSALVPGGGASAHSQVYTIDPSGGAVTQLTHVASDRAAASPDWSPDGKRIAYESNQSGGFQIWVMNADGTGEIALTRERGYEDFQPSFSPDGSRIVFSRCGEPFGSIAFCDVDSINVDGTGRRTLLHAGHWTNVRPEYSPSGREITFHSDRGGYISSVWTMRSDGSHLRRLTPPSIEGFWPDYSPDGRRIIFGDNFGRPTTNTWSMRASGGGLHKLTHLPGAGDGFSNYSPSGTRIVTLGGDACPRASNCFSIINADGSHLQPVFTHIDNTFLTDWGSGP